MSRLEKLEGDAWREFVTAPIAVLVLADRSCPVCKAWSEELTSFLETDQRWRSVRFGEIFPHETGDPAAADEDDDEDDGTPDAIGRAMSAGLSSLAGPQSSFARANKDWIAEADHLPYNVLFVQGKRVKSWPGAGIDRLVTRLEGIASR